MGAGLTALDMIVVLLVAAGAVLGLLRGFVAEMLSLAAWIAAIVAVKLVHARVADALAGPVGTDAGATVLAFALVFGMVFIGVKFLSRAASRRVRGSILGPFDRFLGLGFGALKGLIGATLLFLFASLIHDTLHGAATPRPTWMTASRTYPLMRASSGALVDFVQQRRGR